MQGPFVGFRHSIDNGVSWVEPRIEMAKDFDTYKAADNIFAEKGPVCEDGQISGAPQYSCNGTWKGKVKFGAPHVVRSCGLSILRSQRVCKCSSASSLCVHISQW
eukprot:COSAG02_NODE_4750_length_5026_cov_2.873960_4_plen_105_part_00